MVKSLENLSERGKELREKWLQLQDESDTCMYEGCEDGQHKRVFEPRVMMGIEVCRYHFLKGKYDNDTDRALNARSFFGKEWSEIKEEHEQVKARV